ncbi:Esterase LipI [Paramyrothecium foliicola]|nr:Esterase LipI [Paramyrothecium foliicola]
MSVTRVDPDFAEHLKALGPPPAGSPVTNVLEYREKANKFIGGLLSLLPGSDDVIETRHTVKSYDGAEVTVYRFAKKEATQATEPQPAQFYLHGGGVVSCPIDGVCRPGVVRHVAETGVQAFAVEYRFAPEFPFPAPVEDCYAAVQWVQANAEELNVDPSRLILYGQSGGACLAAGVSLMARDRDLSPKIAKQVLVYPMLDDRSKAKPDSAWEAVVAEYRVFVNLCWDAYVGAENSGRPEADVSPYASPARAESLAHLPSTYIDCGTLDAFRDESLAFAARLAADDVEVEMHLYAGVPHVFDILAPRCQIALSAAENRKRAILSV